MITDDRVLNVLEQAIDWMEDPDNQNEMKKWDHYGFSCGDVGAQGWEFHTKLEPEGLVTKTHDVNNGSQYRVVDVAEAKDYLERARSKEEENSEEQLPNPDLEAREVETISSDELFDNLVGHENKIKWVRKTIQEGLNVHHLLYGEPGSGKSVILDEVHKLEDARRVVMAGNQASAAGIRDIVLEEHPDYLIVEEIEKGSKADREALMTICGQGYVTKTKAGESLEIQVDTTVVAAGNQLNKITPESLRRRFNKIPFEKYTEEEYAEVCAGVLPNQCDISPESARKIAHEIYRLTKSTSVRRAERVARLCDDIDEVGELLDVVGPN